MTEIIKKLLAHITQECTKIDAERAFDEMLDECYSFDKVGGPFAHMSPSRVLLECDPIAHRCGVNDYADGQRDVWTEFEGDYYETREVDKARESFVDDLNLELSDLEKQLETAKSERDEDQAWDFQIDKLKSEIESKQEEIKECEEYEF